MRIFGMLSLCLASVAAAQIPASFEAPVLGYLLDADSRTIRPIAGIAGNSRIDAPLSLPVTIEAAAFLPDNRHAILSSPESNELLVLDLKLIHAAPIAGAPSLPASIKLSSSGKAAAFFYSDSKKLLIAGGFPNAPAILASIDTSFTSGALRRFAITDDGKAALLAFSSTIEGQPDSLYSWNAATGSHFVTNADRISDVAILGEAGIVLDSIRDQVLWIPNIQGDAAPNLAVASGDGLSHPVAVLTSPRNEVYVGDSEGTILILDSAGRIARMASCGCEITSISTLANSAIRLTDRVDRPILVLDPNNEDRIFFVPALSPPTLNGSGQ
jgi:hypothetical protein